MKHTPMRLIQGTHSIDGCHITLLLAWFFNGRRIGRVFTDQEAIAELDAQYILINLAIGGWAEDPDETTIWPAYYDTDYVKIWQLSSEFAADDQCLNIG